jgi:hypothetical protein
VQVTISGSLTEKVSNPNFNSPDETYLLTTDTFTAITIQMLDNTQVSVSLSNDNGISRCALYGPDIAPTLITTPVPLSIKYPLGSATALTTNMPLCHLNPVDFPQCTVASTYSLAVFDSRTGLTVPS